MPHPTLQLARTLFAAVCCSAAVASAQSVCGEWVPLIETIRGGFPEAGARISEMIVFDDGSGPMLYAGGNFEVIIDPVFGEVRAPGLARWDGTRWSAVPGLVGPGLELDGRVIALEVWDNGTGPALYMGGAFSTAAGLDANRIVRWDGATWTTLGDRSLPGLLGRVIAIQPHDFGDGEHLYVGGDFVFGPAQPAPGVHRWDGIAWSTAGESGPTDGAVYEMTSFAGDLYASGRFIRLGDATGAGIGRFDGSEWSVPAGPGQEVLSNEFWPLLPHTIDGAEVLVAGGRFGIREGGDHIATRLANWDGTRWSPMDPALPLPFQPIDIVAFDDGSGETLFVSGNEIAQRSGIGRLRDGEIQPLQQGVDSGGFDMFVHDDGSGPALYVAGNFIDFSGGPSFLARWQPGPRCRLDLSGDCLLDVYDFLAFQDLFMSGDPAADFDGDGSLTIFDFLAFQNAFDAGCP
ncbi:MAG: hypothetical protein NCW75_00695 [Phycisphaera sp.]|nr:MAG: hypothetical protein NCW75_00695 [Phycisphaera sp.]